MVTLQKFSSKAFVALFCLLTIACNQMPVVVSPPPRAIDGVLDLRNWDFAENEAVHLSGEWAFYWEELLEPALTISQIPTANVTVPGIWAEYALDEFEFTPEGFATYRLILHPPATQQTYGIYLEGEGSAYSFWVDGRLLAQNGVVSSSPEFMIPEKKPVTIFFEPQGETVELVMQISNFHHRKGGFRNELLLGLAEPIHRYQMRNWFIEAFSVGILFVMGLYHLFLYFFRTKDQAPLYFGLLCWGTALRSGVTNQSILLIQLPFISWEMALRLEYLVFYLSPVFFVLFLKKLYPDDIHRWFIWFVVGTGAAFSTFLLFADTISISYSPTYYQAIYLLEIIYCIYFLARIIFNRRTGAFFVGFASFILFAAIIIETLYLQNVIDAIQITDAVPIENVSSFGFLAFIFVQSILLANLFSNSYKNVESLSADLELSNVNLEQSERKYRTLFEESKDVIFIADLNGQIEDVSPACQEVLGFEKEELVQMSMYDVVADPADGEQFREIFIQHGAVTNFESILTHKDGRIIHILVSATQRFGENGRVIGLQGSMRDITARKQIEAEKLRSLELEQIAITDPLTKLYNRRIVDQVTKNEIERAKRESYPVALILFDIDHFKAVNDAFGHFVGDEVLVQFASLCQENVRNMDFLARFGGEEFLLLMPNADEEAALAAAENLRQIVEGTPFKLSKSEVIITISLGIAIWHPMNPVAKNSLFNRADRALYQSKNSGRNLATIWRDAKVAEKDRSYAIIRKIGPI